MSTDALPLSWYQAVLDDMTFQAGWFADVEDGAQRFRAAGVSLRVGFHGIPAHGKSPDTTPIFQIQFIPDFRFNKGDELRFARCILEAVKFLHTHEAQEWTRYRGVFVVDPHPAVEMSYGRGCLPWTQIDRSAIDNG